MIRHGFALTAHDLRVRRNALIGWSAGLALTMIAFIAMFPSIKSLDFEKIAQQYPEGLLKAFGVTSLDSLGEAGGFLNLELFGAMLPLAIIFLPIGMVAHAISGDEDRGYLGALLALPVSRRSVMFGACASAVAAHLLAIFVIVATSLIASVIVGAGLTFSDIATSSVSTLPLGALAASIAAVLAGASRRRGLATAGAGAVLVAMYLMQVLASFSGFFHDIRNLSVFQYYNEWINNGITWTAFVVVLIISAGLMVVAGTLFSRRDIG